MTVHMFGFVIIHLLNWAATHFLKVLKRSQINWLLLLVKRHFYRDLLQDLHLSPDLLFLTYLLASRGVLRSAVFNPLIGDQNYEKNGSSFGLD